jgi:TRAP-type C4-dicarboxylate transport system substrate-binding protein
MKNRRPFNKVWGSICIMILLSLMVPGFVIGAEKPLKLRCVMGLPADHPAMAKGVEYAKLVNQYSGGKLTVDIIGGPEAIPLMEQAEALKSGMIDINVTMGGWIAGLMPLGDALILTPRAVSVRRDTELVAFYREIMGKQINAYYLGAHCAPQWFGFAGNVIVKDPRKDFKGKKARSISLTFPIWEAVGAIPVNMPASDIYTALERKVVDCVSYGMSGWVKMGWPEVVKYRYPVKVFYGDNTTLLVNLKVWNSLSKEQQNWLQQPVLDHEDEWARYWEAAYAAEEEAIIKAGMQRLKWSDEDIKWFEQLASSELWKVMLKKNPVDGPRFKALVDKMSR